METNKRIVIRSGISKELDISSYFNYDQISITVSENAHVKILASILDNIRDIRIRINVKENASSDVVFADFASSSHKVVGLIKLEGENSESSWKTSCLSKEKEEKQYDISFIHMTKNTKSKMENYGVATNQSKLTFKGVSHIQNNANKSTANQDAKIIVFDDDVVASSSPSLRIDNNDINASHSAIVGRLNEEHLYYLMSRGLSEEQSRKLITFGYLSPIANYFGNEIKEKILNMISVRF